MGGVEIVGFTEVEGFGVSLGERESWLDADEKSVVFSGELGEGIEGRF